MSDRSIAGQFTDNTNDPNFIQRATQAYEALQAAKINGLIEIDTGSRTIRVTVDPSQRDAARQALSQILPNVPRRLKMRVDANSLRRVTPAIPVIMPGEEITIGRSSVGSYGDKMIIIDDDSKITRQHLKVRWDGLMKLEVKDVSGQNDARIDTVEIGSEWFEVETGAKIRIGDTFITFQLGDPVN